MMEGIIGGILALMFLVFALALPLLPICLINVPNKQHWLAEERRTVSLAFLSQRFLMLGIVTFVFLILINQEVFKANLRQPQQLSDDFGITLIAYGVFIVYWVVGLLLRFRKPRNFESET